MKPSEAAQRLGYRSVAHVRTLITLGLLTATRQIDGSYEITEHALKRFQRDYKPDPRGRKRGATNG
jgi:hypothetical protein